MPAGFTSSLEASREWLPFLIAVTVGLAAAWFIKHAIFKFATRMAKKTAVQWDDVLIERIHGPATVLVITFALMFCFDFAPLTAAHKMKIAPIFHAIAILATTWLFN